MEEKKLKTIVSVVTALVVFALVAMVIGLIFQFVHLSNLKKKQTELQQQIAYYTNVSDDAKEKIDYYKNSEALEDMYRALGYSADGDIKFK